MEVANAGCAHARAPESSTPAARTESRILRSGERPFNPRCLPLQAALRIVPSPSQLYVNRLSRTASSPASRATIQLWTLPGADAGRRGGVLLRASSAQRREIGHDESHTLSLDPTEIAHLVQALLHARPGGAGPGGELVLGERQLNR